MRVFRTPIGMLGLGLLVLVVVLAVIGPVLWGDAAAHTDPSQGLRGASADHWIGTDHLGRDLFARVIVATRLSLVLAVLATLISTVVGLALGAAPMFLGRRLGRLMTALINILVAFPALLLVLFLATIFGVGTTGAVLAVGLAGAPAFARLLQTLIASVEGLDYIAAARIAGVGRLRTLVRHVLPNIAEPLIVSVTIGAGTSLLVFAGLSFLGLGVQLPSYDWGRLMQDNLERIYTEPLAALVPGLAVVITGLAFNLTGEAVARSFGVAANAMLPLVPTAPAPTAQGALASPTSADHVTGAGLLDVHDLWVGFPSGTTPDGVAHPVRGVSFSLRHGEAVGIVGESGSGKSLTALAIARLLEDPAVVRAERLDFAGHDLLDPADRRALLGTSLAMVFQDPMTSFNPAHRMGSQLAEVGRYHLDLDRRSARDRAIDRLRAVRISEPERRARQYPFEFSGGMRQRAMIGMGLMGSPDLIIADEPTTALDVTVQRDVLDLLRSVRETDGVAVLLISHDVSVVREVCDRVLVMYAGRIVEDLPVDEIDRARHPYTRALLAAVPDMDTDLNAPLAAIPGQPVDPSHVPAGCAYAARCPLADARCRHDDPTLIPVPDRSQRVACWHPVEPAGLIAAEAVDRR